MAGMLQRSRIVRAAGLGLVVALAGAAVTATPVGRWVEEATGLRWLFTLRGERPAPEAVAVVTIDRRSSRRLGLENEPRKWPRGLHARLVRELAGRGAAVIAFDVIFDEARDPAQDRALGEAIREAGNVLLFEYLQRETVDVDHPSGAALGAVTIERRLPPIPALAEAALGTGPFPLPKVPARVSQVWLFKPESGEAPTLPALALQVYALAVYDELLARLRAEAPGQAEALPATAERLREGRSVDEAVRRLRLLFRSRPSLAAHLSRRIEEAQTHSDPGRAAMLRALVGLYGGAHSRYLDLYGPPHSIRTVPYHEVLEGRGGDLAGKAVFVGFSEQLQPEQKDGFYTVFSQRDGLDVSGVEIVATAFANLLEGRSVHRPAPVLELALVLGWGLALGMVLGRLPGRAVIPAAVGLAALYLASAYHLFAQQGQWLPLVVPLLGQVPLAVVGALLTSYRLAQHERETIREAFGYHLPAEVVDRLARGLEQVTGSARQVYGICLASDAGRYTALSERMAPDALRALMNRYYQTLFAPVRRAGGEISDVVGDAMLAIWAAPSPSTDLRRRACEAALEIVAALDARAREGAEDGLPTRIGLHCGDVVLGHVGAIDHYEYRAVGDIVNTATRIEGLAKTLGTPLLASDEMLQGLSGIAARPLGRFRLAGKTRPVCVHELLRPQDAPGAEALAAFARGLEAFRAARWDEAAGAFRVALAAHGEDGPARFYLALCERYRGRSAAQWDGVVPLSE